MKTKRVMISMALLAIMVFSVASIYGLKPVKLTQTNNFPTAIDGDLADWAGLPNYNLTDPSDDSLLANDELYSLAITVNDTHIFFAYKVQVSEATLLYIDTDPGASTGLTNIQNAASYGNRPITLGNGFGAEWFVGSWNMGAPALFNGTNNGAWIDYTTLPGVAMAVDATNGIFEVAMPFSLLFGTNDVTGREIGVMLVASGGDGVTCVDLLPNDPFLQTLPSVNDAYTTSNYLIIPLDSNDDGKADIMPMPTPGWAGSINANTVSGNATAGLPLIINLEVWWHDADNNAVHDHPNTTEGVKVYITITNATAGNGTVVEEYTTTMVHTPYQYAGIGDGNDVYTMLIPGTKLVEGYNVSLIFEVTGYDSNLTKYYLVGPAPLTNVGWVGSVNPTGGFVPPDTPFTIEAQAYWFNNDTGDVLHDSEYEVLDMDMFLYYVINDNDTWTKVKMDYVGAEGNNDKYSYTLGPYEINTTITFYVNATASAGWMATANYTVTVGYEPPFSTIYSQDDPQGDEYGIYPTNEVFSPFFGFFDILYFEVAANDYHVRFSLQFYNISFNGWGGGNGFSHEIITIYIDNAQGGRTDTLRNEQVVIESAHAWDQMVVANGWGQSIVNANDAENPINTGLTVSSDPATGFINITIPIELIGMPQDDWAYVVLAGSQDFDKFRSHVAEAQEWQFGGGDDSDIDPNVVDMLVPRGGNETETQFFLLNNYDVATQRQATVYAVGKNIQFEEDTTAPTITIVSPTEGQKFNVTNGTVSIPVQLTITDPQQGLLAGLKKVQIFDGTILVTEILLNGLEASVDVTVNITDITESGNRTLKFVVEDVSGNTATGQVTVYLEVPTTAKPTSTTTESPGFLPFPWFAAISTLAIIPIVKKIKK